MRYLTLKGYLETQLIKLSKTGEKSVNKLSRELTSGNRKLKEPLILFAMCSQKRESLQKLLTKNGILAHEFVEHFSKIYFEKSVEEIIGDKDSTLPKEYKDIYVAFLKERNRHKIGDKTKLLMKSYIEMYKKQHGITNYRIYTDLKLNPGNFNDFMKNENMDKLSLEDVKDVVEYLKNYEKKKR